MADQNPKMQPMFLPGVEQNSQPGPYADMIRMMQDSGSEYPQIWHMFAYLPKATEHLARFTQEILRGPGAWNIDAAVQKNFKITERFGLQFRAEGFNVINHHDLFVNTGTLYWFAEGPTLAPGVPNTMATGSNQVVALKGGLNSLALGGNHDERRFGQFSLRLTF